MTVTCASSGVPIPADLFGSTLRVGIVASPVGGTMVHGYSSLV